MGNRVFCEIVDFDSDSGIIGVPTIYRGIPLLGYIFYKKTHHFTINKVVSGSEIPHTRKA